MFKISLFLLSLFFVFQVFGTVTMDQYDDATYYSFSDLSIQTENVQIEKNHFTKTIIAGAEGFEGVLFELGMPEIPVIRFYAPQGELEVVFNDQKDFNETKNLKLDLIPNLESLEKIPGSFRKLMINKNLGKSNAFYPSKRFDSNYVGSVRGEKLQLITIYPFTWNPTTKTYNFVTNFQVVVRHASLQKEVSDQTVKSIAFVIGRQFKDSPAITQYENFKKQLGFNVIRVVVEGNITTPEAIRAKLQDLYRKNNLNYALIFGDAEHVPSKKSTNISGVTDHFYSAIDTDVYATDINTPDIGVGRVTIKNEQELQAVVNKFIKYQSAQFSSEEWLKGIAFIATNDRYEVAEGTHNYAIETYTTPRNYVGVFPNSNQPGGDKLYAITYRVRNDQVVSTMNLGRAIINYSGHGATNMWAGPTVTQSNVRSLNHADALPFVISNACITGQFTVNESFAETWIKHPQGSIMFWGSMDSTYWDEDDFLERDMYKGIYDLNKADFAEITQYALSELWKRYGGQNRSKYYWETYITFGDPSIALRTNPTQKLQIYGPETQEIGLTDLNYEVSYADGAKAVNATITLFQNNTPIATRRSDEQGRVSFKLSQNIPAGEYIVKAFARNSMVELSKVVIK